MRVKRRDTEQWMAHRLLPENLKERILRHEQYRWQETRGVDEEGLLMNLPKDLRREIKRHLCLSLLKKVCSHIFSFLGKSHTISLHGSTVFYYSSIIPVQYHIYRRGSHTLTVPMEIYRTIPMQTFQFWEMPHSYSYSHQCPVMWDLDPHSYSHPIVFFRVETLQWHGSSIPISSAELYRLNCTNCIKSYAENWIFLTPTVHPLHMQ
jgi:hypothetical protein